MLVIFSLVYIFVFSGYYVLVNFLNIMYPNNAFWSFAIFYGIYAIGSIFAPLLLFNLRLILFLSAFSFLFLIGFGSSYILALLFIGSAIAGFGNSFIWLIQGIYLTELKKTEGMSIFYSLFSINMIVGNLISLTILLTGVRLQIVMFCMLGLSGIGVLFSIFVKNIELPKKEYSILKVFLSSKQCYPVILLMVYSAVGLNVTYQIIPRLLVSNTVGTVQYKNICNAVIYIVYGVSAMCSSFLWGKLFNKSWKYVLIPYTILEGCCLIGMFFLSKFNDNSYYWVLIGLARGCIDYGVNNLINMTLEKCEDTNLVFAFYRFTYAISYLLTAIGIGYIPYEYILLICGIFSLFSALVYYFEIDI